MCRAPLLPNIRNKRFFEKPELSPLTQRYWEHTFGTAPSPGGPDPWLVELCRITIPDAYIGICKSFEQYVYHPDIQEPQTYSLNANWGDPFVLPANVNITWLFRLERAETPEPPRLNITNPNPQIPGEPHFEISEMSDLWYPAASPVGQNFHLTIGGRYRFRVFALMGATDYAIDIAAKIRGFRLSSFSKMTSLPIRSIW